MTQANIFRRPILFVIIYFLVAQFANSQSFVFHGTIVDAETKQGVPMVNIIFKGTTTGTISDARGYFMLKTNLPGDTLLFKSLGYEDYETSAKNIKSPLVVEMIPEDIALSEIDVSPDDSQVRHLLKAMVKNKKRNNPENHNRFNYEKYTKWEYHISHTDSTLMQSVNFKNHKQHFRKDDDGSHYLPVYLSEQIVFNEIQRDPPKQRSTILGDNTSGLGMLGELEVGGYTSGLDVEFSFYDNTIKLFEENFISPASSNGWFYYKYYLEDSTIVNGTKHYTILYFPRRKQDKVFKGHLVIEDRYFSLLEVDAELSTKSNMNFLKSMRLASHYQLIKDTIPFYGKNTIQAVFDYLPLDIPSSKKKMELDFTQISSFSKVTIDPPTLIQLSAKNISYESLKQKGSYERDSLFWENSRHLPLTTNEIELFSAIDSANKIPIIKTIDNMAQMSMTGYYDFGKFELGPYMQIIQSNKIEGLKLFAGLRTSNDISKNWMIWGGAGFATKTNKWTGMLGGGYRFENPKRRVIKLAYDDNYARIGENRKILLLYENMLSPNENNLLSSFLARDEFDELFHKQDINLSYEHEWRTGFSTQLDLGAFRHHSPEYYPFIYNSNPVSHVDVLEANLDFRFSWKEKLLDNEFMRYYMSTDYPIIHLSLGAGRVNYGNEEENFAKLHTTIKHNFFLGQSLLNFAIEGGIIWGKIPYTLLEIPRGNESYGYYSYDFNLLNYLEFVHDRYLHAYFEYHLNGFFFNRVPLLRSLGCREVFSVKSMIGDLSRKQHKSIDLPGSVSSLDGNPYLEVGTGIENILRILRIEATYRVTPKSTIGVSDFGILATLKLNL